MALCNKLEGIISYVIYLKISDDVPSFLHISLIQVVEFDCDIKIYERKNRMIILLLREMLVNSQYDGPEANLGSKSVLRI